MNEYVYYISEMFNEFENLKSRKQKLAFLQKHKKHAMFKAVLQGAFDPNIQWFMPKNLSYTPHGGPIGTNESNLHMEMPKCTVFAKDHPAGAGVSDKRLKELLLQVLESMHPAESMLYEQMLKKKLKVKGLTESLVLEAFPDLYREV